jgi:DNA polymerase III psi subunit
MKEDSFFLPLFIKETLYLFHKEANIYANVSEEVPTLLASESNLQEQTTQNLPFLVLHEEAMPLSPPLEELLGNILKAIRIPLNQIEKRSLGDFQPIMAKERTFILIFSSSSIPKLFSSLEKNKTRALTQDTQVLFSDALAELSNDKTKKMALWTELKRVFT